MRTISYNTLMATASGGISFDDAILDSLISSQDLNDKHLLYTGPDHSQLPFAVDHVSTLIKDLRNQGITFWRGFKVKDMINILKGRGLDVFKSRLQSCPAMFGILMPDEIEDCLQREYVIKEIL